MVSSHRALDGRRSCLTRKVTLGCDKLGWCRCPTSAIMSRGARASWFGVSITCTVVSENTAKYKSSTNPFIVMETPRNTGLLVEMIITFHNLKRLTTRFLNYFFVHVTILNSTLFFIFLCHYYLMYLFYQRFTLSFLFNARCSLLLKIVTQNRTSSLTSAFIHTIFLFNPTRHN